MVFVGLATIIGKPTKEIQKLVLPLLIPMVERDFSMMAKKSNMKTIKLFINEWTVIWYLDLQRHREDGPAQLIKKNQYKMYGLFGHQKSKEEIQRLYNKLPLDD